SQESGPPVGQRFADEARCAGRTAAATERQSVLAAVRSQTRRNRPFIGTCGMEIHDFPRALSHPRRPKPTPTLGPTSGLKSRVEPHQWAVSQESGPPVGPPLVGKARCAGLPSVAAKRKWVLDAVSTSARRN